MANGVTISFYGTNKLKERLERTAQFEGRSVSNLLCRLIDRHVPVSFCPICSCPTITTVEGDNWCPNCNSAMPTNGKES